MAEGTSVATNAQSASPWSPLSHSVFRALWIASVTSSIGTWMQNVGGTWLMTTLSPSSTHVALMQTATSLPLLFLAVPSGALADIVDRRKYLLLTQGWMLLSAAALGGLTLAGLMTPWVLLALTFSVGVGAALNMPVWQAITPELVPRAKLTSAIALGGVGINIARAVGPALGGFVVAALGPGAVFLINAASFVGVLAVLGRWRREPRSSPWPVERWWSAMRAGARYVRHAPELRTVLVRAAAFVLPASALWALLPVIAKRELGLDSLGYGGLLGCLGLGALTGAVLLPRLRKRTPIDATVAIGTLLFAASSATVAVSRSLPVLGVSLWIGGAAWLFLLASLNTAAQLAAPAWVQARALGFYLMVFQGGMAIASAAWGTIADYTSTSVALEAAAASLVVLLATALFWHLGSSVGRDLGPALHWPEPALAIEPQNEVGPVLVTVEYRVAPERRREFIEALGHLARVRRRDGASCWAVFQDVADPTKQLETFLVDSWGEHLRQHGRVTVDDRAIEDRVHSFQIDGSAPVVHHFLSSDRGDRPS